ncbi:hypothetical protein HJ526_00850 [Donghicola sp. C2-DW-16]|uniref:Flagellar hook-length control protein-like C-terminal domain-containing protein n=1 Tax=Donghicola mangrovi TaxID=2729614 RepID=A0ABX2PBB1_9RHOB|nr:hypothetical protein [Donghicola mangrovi]NVO25954.1 hypothetical protein [Donghicola mangrovi]
MIPPVLQPALFRQTCDLSGSLRIDEEFSFFQDLMLELDDSAQDSQNAELPDDVDLVGEDISSFGMNGSRWCPEGAPELRQKQIKVSHLASVQEEEGGVPEGLELRNSYLKIECENFENFVPEEKGDFKSIALVCERGEFMRPVQEKVSKILEGGKEKYEIDPDDLSVGADSDRKSEDSEQNLNLPMHSSDFSQVEHKSFVSKDGSLSRIDRKETFPSQELLRPGSAMPEVGAISGYSDVSVESIHDNDFEISLGIISEFYEKDLQAPRDVASILHFPHSEDGFRNNVQKGQNSHSSVENPVSLTGAKPARSVHLHFDQVQEIVKVGVSSRVESAIEVELQPHDLGRMKLVFQRDTEGMAVTIDADRSETIDKIKRLLDQFNNEAKQTMEAPIRFRFETGAFSSGGRDAHSNSRPSYTNKARLYEGSLTESEDHAAPMQHSKILGQIDIRA